MSKKLVTAAFALSLLCGTSALAQPDDHHRGGGGAPQGGEGAPHGAPGGGAAPHGAPSGGGAPHGAAGGAGGGAVHFTPPGGGAAHFTPPGAGAPHVGPTGGAPTHFNHTGSAGPAGPATAHGNPYAGRHNNHVGTGIAVGAGALAVGAAIHAGAHPHYNAQAYPHAIQPQRQYHYNGSWNPPRGFYYRHWGYGDHLPYGWYARPYWIMDWDFYDLPPAPYGYQWVRQGPDALLVNIYNGRVVEVEYGLFY